MNNPTILLVDNGSIRPESILNLRRLAADVGKASGQVIHPVSLQHADKVDPALLDGQTANVFTGFLRQALERRVRAFIALPLFFGQSRALSVFIPGQLAKLKEQFGPFELQLADTLATPSRGEPLLARILCDNIRTAAEAGKTEPHNIILVDHGSPLPEVAQVRSILAKQMRECLGDEARISEAAMERRPGQDYDFNGPLLSDVLKDQAQTEPDGKAILSLLFLNPGRHAGPGGDIDGICDQLRREFPEFDAITSPLVGTHPALVELLLKRLKEIIPVAHGFSVF